MVNSLSNNLANTTSTTLFYGVIPEWFSYHFQGEVFFTPLIEALCIGLMQGSVIATPIWYESHSAPISYLHLQFSHGNGGTGTLDQEQTARPRPFNDVQDLGQGEDDINPYRSTCKYYNRFFLNSQDFLIKIVTRCCSWELTFPRRKAYVTY